MSVSYGFYNSVYGDRVYNAEQFSAIFDGLIADGVYETYGNKFIVGASNPASMSVNVGTGRAWFNHTWTVNDAMLTLTLSESDLNNPRIDVVVLEVNRETDVRANSIKIITGTPAASPVAPALINSGDVHQYPLAEIRVDARVTAITQASITNKVGTSSCPFVTGIIEMMDIDALVAQWTAQWNEYIVSHEEDLDTWIASFESELTSWKVAFEEEFTSWKAGFKSSNETEMEEWKTNFENTADIWYAARQSAFETWFDHMKGQLSTDAAGHLQLEIDSLKFNSDAGEKCTTVFNSDGSITQTYSDRIKNTVFETDGSITETLTDLSSVVYARKNTVFNADGSITETIAKI